MDILIIGGTRFLGRALSEDLNQRGHSITLFHRGNTNPDFLASEPRVKHIMGDRETDMENLGDQKWDAVIDTCGYYPKIVKTSVKYLQDKVKQYIFISTISVYTESEVPHRDESAELIELEDPDIQLDASADAYGGLKALCEQEVLQIFGNNATIIRPGLIVGPHDPTNRFTYWPVRIRRGGNVLAPGDGSFPLQIIDVRDLAAFTIDLIEQEENGTFNATGPDYKLTLADLLQTAINVINAEVELHWAPEEWLTEQEIQPWSELPLWLPSESGRALMQVSIKRALDKGIDFMPLDKIIMDTLNWYDSVNGDTHEWSAGLDPQKEQKLIEILE